MFRYPSFGMAEIAWRWSFGAAAVSLIAFTFLEYLRTLEVSSADLLLLRSRQPIFVLRALQDIFRGSGFRVVRADLILTLGIASAWIVLASFARGAITNGLLDHFHNRFGTVTEERRWRVGPLVALNALRLVALFAAMIGSGAALIAADALPGDSSGGSFIVTSGVFGLILLAWAMINWFLSLAAIFVVRDGLDSFASMAAAIAFFAEHFASVLAVGTWFGMVHAATFVGATITVLVLIGWVTLLPGAVVLLSILLVTLLYFALADFLYAGRLAAYLAILEMAPMPVTAPPAPVAQPRLPISNRIDPDELILSDLPVPG